MVCGRVPKFCSVIMLSGELVPDFNYFKKFQVFKFLNPVGSQQKVVYILDLAGRNVEMAGRLRTVLCVQTETCFENGERLPIGRFLGYKYGI